MIKLEGGLDVLGPVQHTHRELMIKWEESGGPIVSARVTG